jgi:histidine triad (HIT) family protein
MAPSPVPLFSKDQAMAYNPDNIFAKILRAELPCIRVYEDDKVLCFMDLMPQSPGHTLVVPKEAAETIFELSPASAAACIAVAQRLAAAVKTAVAAEGIMLAQFNGAAAGQTVPHVHFHVIPRWAGREVKGHATERVDTEQLKATAAKIVAALEGV